MADLGTPAVLQHRPSLAGSVQVVARHLAPTLVPPDRLSRILEVARLLPPVAVAGFECRLAGPDRQVDFAVHLPSSDRTFSLFAGRNPSHELAPELLGDPAWSGIRGVCRNVNSPGGVLRGLVDNLWLEFDLPTGTATGPPPALFFSTGPRVSTSPRQYVEVVESVLATLGLGPPSPPLRVGILRATQLLPAGSGVFQFGLRVGDRVPAMRLCISGIPPGQLLRYLRDLGWQHDPAPVRRAVDRLVAVTDDLVLDVDVGAEIGARIGLEAHLRGPKRPVLDRRWTTVLDWLVDDGLCSRQARRDLAAWPGTSFPAADLMPGSSGFGAVSKLLGGRTSVCFLRGLHHLKVVCDPVAGLEAKAYIGFTRHWVGTAARPATLEHRPATDHVAGVGPHDVTERAIASGLGFLAAARSPTGWWQDFRLGTGLSDAWVTAYTGRALAEVPGAAAAEMAGDAWRVLAGRHDPGGGWGYNLRVPADADTTTWALLLAERVGDTSSPRLAEARSFLAGHLLPGGGIATYTEAAPLRTLMFLPDSMSLAGWTAAHPCVSAAAANLASFAPRLGRYLLRAQRPDGSWPAYWWADREYATRTRCAGAVRPRPDHDRLGRADTARN